MCRDISNAEKKRKTAARDERFSEFAVKFSPGIICGLANKIYLSVVHNGKRCGFFVGCSASLAFF